MKNKFIDDEAQEWMDHQNYFTQSGVDVHTESDPIGGSLGIPKKPLPEIDVDAVV